MWEKRDFGVVVAYSIYSAIVLSGSYYYSWTPVCFVYPVLGPKSKCGMFIYKQYIEFKKYLLDSVARIDELKGKWNIKVFLLCLSYNLYVPSCIYISLSHALAVYALYIILTASCNAGTVYFTLALWPITGLGITAGAHRLWAHRSYQAHWSLRLVLMLLNSMANQLCIWDWVRDHRTHHLHSDTAADPHDSTRGFFFSHMGWLLLRKSNVSLEACRKIDLRDLQADPIVMFQKRVQPWWNLLWCFGIPAAVSMHMWDETLVNGLLLPGVLRYVYVLHCTWCVNSIAHSFGVSTYDTTQPPGESRITAFVAIGEGWHSWHHAFAFDYATSELGCLQQYNPTKVFIDLMAMLGLVTNRKRGTRLWNERKEMWKRTQNCQIVETLEGPPMFKTRKLTFVAKEDATDIKVQVADWPVEKPSGSFFRNIVDNIPRGSTDLTIFSVSRYLAYVYSLCALPWPIISCVVMLDLIVPAKWVTYRKRDTGAMAAVNFAMHMN